MDVWIMGDSRIGQDRMDNWEEKARVCRLVSCRIRRSQKRWFLVLGVRLIDLLYDHPSVFGRWGMGFSSQRPYYDMTANMYQPSLLNSFSPSLRILPNGFLSTARTSKSAGRGYAGTIADFSPTAGSTS
jgi:hypothetical protein